MTPANGVCSDQMADEPEEKQRFGQNYFLDRVNQVIDNERGKALTPNSILNVLGSGANSRTGMASKPISIATAMNTNFLNLAAPLTNPTTYHQQMMFQQTRGRP